MKWLLFCLAVGVLPAAGEPREAPVAPITLYTQFQQDPPKAVLEAIQAELESIMSPMGLNFLWRSLSAASGSEVSVELAVVHFKGTCNVTSHEPHNPGPGALGRTYVSDGSILPFVDVDCDRIGSFVQQGLMALDRDGREGAFGRAVGRVLAHEMYHILPIPCGTDRRVWAKRPTRCGNFSATVSSLRSRSRRHCAPARRTRRCGMAAEFSRSWQAKALVCPTSLIVCDDLDHAQNRNLPLSCPDAFGRRQEARQSAGAGSGRRASEK